MRRCSPPLLSAALSPGARPHNYGPVLHTVQSPSPRRTPPPPTPTSSPRRTPPPPTPTSSPRRTPPPPTTRPGTPPGRTRPRPFSTRPPPRSPSATSRRGANRGRRARAARLRRTCGGCRGRAAAACRRATCGACRGPTGPHPPSPGPAVQSPRRPTSGLKWTWMRTRRYAPRSDRERPSSLCNSSPGPLEVQGSGLWRLDQPSLGPTPTIFRAWVSLKMPQK